MIRYFILCLFVFASCSKQDSSSVKTDNENNFHKENINVRRLRSGSHRIIELCIAVMVNKDKNFAITIDPK